MKSAGIRRYNRPERDFEMIHRSFMRLSTKQLSMRGRTVALFVLSHDYGYVLTQEAIARRLELAVRTVAEALKDLEAAGLLVRIEERNARGHRTGTAMHVSDVPFTDEERADLLESLPAKSADAESPPADFAGPKKSNSKQESKREEDQPSGRGVSPAPEPDPSTEEDMRRAVTADQSALFDAPAPPEAVKKKRKDPAEANDASAVLASFITSYGEHHGGRRPLGSDIGKVGRAAKLILGRAEATLEELIKCAARMGRGEYSDLFRELSFSRPATRGAVIPARRDDEDSWAGMAAATAARLQEIAGVPA